MLALAAGSGAAALIYEIVWFQLLELTVGSTAVSLAVVLATFMGGMCIGSLLLPRVPARHRPLRVYAAIELGIGAFGILVLRLTPLVGRVYTSWSGYGTPGFLLRGGAAAVCLLPPTLLMGATLPALARCLEPIREEKTQVGVSWLGFVYAANIAGAVFGCLLSGFYLLREFDVSAATYAAVAANASAAGIALLLAAASRGRPVPAAARMEHHGADTAVYWVIGLSGLCALAAEAIWTRLLGLLFGATVYTFSIILAVYLSGLGIGSGIGSLLARTVARPRQALGVCQLLAGLGVAWTAYNLGAALPFWPIDPSIASNIQFSFELDLARAFWAVLPPTLAWGASFPLALAAAAEKGSGRRDSDSGALMARIYSANTLGAILGALAASLLLIAWVGSQGAEQILIGVSLAAGFILLAPGPRWRAAASIAAILVLGAALIRTVPLLPKLLVAYGRYAATWAGKSDIVYAAEGINSSVAVARFPNGAVTFHVAGKVQASNVPRDMRLQRMLGHLTTLTVGEPRSVLVIGCGAGITAGAVSIDPRVKRETIVEIEPLVPNAAATYFSGPNFDVIRNPKVQVRIDDGRHYVLTTKERFDGITVDPLDPWVKGAANLYTKEFLEAMRQHLNPGGAVTMYVQLFETNQEAVKSVVATFFEVFTHATIWGNPYEGQGHDMVLLGQAEPLRIDLDALERRLREPEFSAVESSLEEVGMDGPVGLFATYAGRKSDLKGWLRGAAINRDRNLRMEYLAGLGLNLDDAARIYAGMLAYRKFPEDMFRSSEGRVDSLRLAMERTDR